MSAEVIVGNCVEVLRGMAVGIVDCCVTSPPYWGLRDYGVDAQLGLEPVPDCLGWATGAPCGECYVCHMVAVFREVRRVLADHGTCWLNLGDSYASQGGGAGGGFDGGFLADRPNEVGTRCRQRAAGTSGLKPKDLVGIPWRVAFALQADGWWLRSDIIWAKGWSFCPDRAGNPMPESVTDRPVRAHEYVFLLTKRERYFYDDFAVREAAAAETVTCLGQASLDTQEGGYKQELYAEDFPGRKRRDRKPADILKHMRDNDGGQTRNLRDVWAINTKGFRGAHFAVFPEALVEPMIRAGCPAGGTVLDPFCGSGTTGVVAIREGRNFIGVELNEQYAQMARRRIASEPLPLFAATEATS